MHLIFLKENVVMLDFYQYKILKTNLFSSLTPEV